MMAIIYLPCLLPDTCICPPMSLGEQPSITHLFDISAHKVYPILMLPLKFVSSYLTFSPLSYFFFKKSMTVIFCGTLLLRFRKAHLLNGMLLYAVRTFLFVKQSDSPTCSKVQNYHFIIIF